MNRRAAAFAALVALAACNSGGNPAPVPTLGPTCQLPPGVQTALVYPAPGSTVSASNVTQLIVGSTAALDPSRFALFITDAVFPFPNFVQPGSGLASVSPPFPAPSATPPFANPQYQASALNAPFSAPQTVTVYVNDGKSGNNCTPLSIGRFSTQ